MRKLFSVMLLLSAILLAQPTQAQGVKIGAKAGFNNTSMSFDKNVFDSENHFGWFVGPVLNVQLPVGGLGFDIAALYDQKETEVNDETIKQKSILIPANLRVNFGLGEAAGIYVAAGPQFGFNVGDDEFSWRTKEDYENTFQLKKSSFSVNLGAGVYLSKHLEVGFTYNIAMGKTADATFKEAISTTFDKDDAKAKSWTLALTYYF